MENLNLNELLDRTKLEMEIKKILESLKHKNTQDKMGIYLYGNPGSGKSEFIKNILIDLNYDIIKYDANDMKNINIIDDISKHAISNQSIMSLFEKKPKRIAIMMDEIDGINNVDKKNSISSLIKLVRPKKTKKQKKEEYTINPIICIGNYKIDKKLKELMKVCNSFELVSPTEKQMFTIINLLFLNCSYELLCNIVSYCDCDLKKCKTLYNLYSNLELKDFENIVLNQITNVRSFNNDTKKITNELFLNKFNISEHLNIMNETERTIVGLLWHENIIDTLKFVSVEKAIPFYLSQLNNICFADYIDRITFQKQIWQFNELSSLIKTMYNNFLFHEFVDEHCKHDKNNFLNEIRFTKVLTKYSTEYNNHLFIQKLCQTLKVDKKDLIAYFLIINSNLNKQQILENNEISKLDSNRMYRYIEKYKNANAQGIIYEDDDESTDELFST